MRVVQTRKALELYIPPGSRDGDRIVLAGEADQEPDQEPGDIIFVLQQADHDVFDRAGNDLRADLHISLVEALTGLSRVVLKHLDGRGIALSVTQPKGKVLRPDQVLKVPGEGMPIKRSDTKGDLYLVVNIDFPEDGWIKDENVVQKIKQALPSPGPPSKDLEAEIVDEVDFDPEADIDDFGGDEGRAGAGWEDDDEEAEGPQCAQQ